MTRFVAGALVTALGLLIVVSWNLKQVADLQSQLTRELVTLAQGLVTLKKIDQVDREDVGWDCDDPKCEKEI